MHNKISFKVFLAIVSTIILWASAFVVIRIGLQDFHPGSLALFRYLVASVGLLVLYVFMPRRSVVPTKDVMPLFLAGAIGIGAYNIALNYGEVSVTSGIASFLVNLIPVVVIILAVIFLKEKLYRRSIVGIIICLAGIGIIAFSHHAEEQHFSLGIVYLLLAALTGGIYHVLSRPLAIKYRPVELAAFMIWSATIVMLIYTPQMLQDLHAASLKTILAGIYLGIFPAIIAYIGWSFVLRKIPASQASPSLYAVPLTATMLGWLMIGELPTTLALTGGIIALVGAIVANPNLFRKKQVPQNVSCCEESVT